jgi:hypothetical protein
MFEALQADFAAALLDAEWPVPQGVTAHTTDVPLKRFSVYRNNVVVGLTNALESRFPAVQRIVGKDFFSAMTHLFVMAHPPHSPLMMTYGDDFPDFIAAFEPAAELCYLADVARLEAARTRAYHAADAKPLEASALATVTAESLPNLRFLLHPSVEFVRSVHPVVTIWAMNAGEMALREITDWRAEDALVSRPKFDVEVRALPAGGASFLESLASNATLGTAAETAKSVHADFDLAINLAGLFSSSLVTGFQPLKEVSP